MLSWCKEALRRRQECYKSSGVAFLRSQNVWNHGIRLNDVAYIDRTIHERMSGTHVAPGDILLNITGASIGRTALVPDSFTEGNVSQHVAIVRLYDKAIRRFVHLSMTVLFQSPIMDVQVLCQGRHEEDSALSIPHHPSASRTDRRQVDIS